MLTFECLLAQATRRPAILNRSDCQKARVAVRLMFQWELFLSQRKMNLPFIATPSSNAEMYTFHFKMINDLRADAGLPIQSFSETRQLIAQYYNEIVEEPKDAVQVANSETDSNATVPSRFKKDSSSSSGDSFHQVKRESSIVLSADSFTSKIFFLNKIGLLTFRNPVAVGRLFSRYPALQAELSNLQQKVIKFEIALMHNVTSPGNLRYVGRSATSRLPDFYVFPMEWLPLIMSIRSALGYHSDHAAQNLECLETQTAHLNRAIAVSEGFFDPSPTWSYQEKDVFNVSHETDFYAALGDRNRFTNASGSFEHVVHVGNCELLKSVTIPMRLFSTRRVKSLDIHSLRHLAAYCEAMCDVIYGMMRRIARFEDLSAIHQRRLNDLRQGYAKAMQMATGIFQTIHVEVTRRMFTETNPVSAHEIILLLRAKSFHTGLTFQSLNFYRRTFWITSNKFHPTPPSLITQLRRRTLAKDVFYQSTFPYMFWLIDGSFQCPPSEKGRFWSRLMTSALSEEMEKSWSFFGNNSMQRIQLCGDVSLAFKNHVSKALSSGWLSPSHLLLHTSWYNPDAAKQRQHSLFRMDFKKNWKPSVGSSGHHWPRIMAYLAAKPEDASLTHFLSLLFPPEALASEEKLYHCGSLIPERSLRNVGEFSIPDASARISIGNALFYACFFGSSYLDPVLVFNLYESYKIAFDGDEAFHCMLLAALVRCGPMTREHTEAYALMVPIAEERIALDRTYERSSNSYTDIHGYMSLSLVSYLPLEWFRMNAPQMLGLPPATESQAHATWFPKHIRRFARIVASMADPFLTLFLATFNASFDKWFHKRAALMERWHGICFAAAKTAHTAEVGHGGELFGMQLVQTPHRQFPLQYSVPFEIDIVFQRFHRALCLHDFTTAFNRSHWDQLFRPLVFGVGYHRGIVCLLQSNSKTAFSPDLDTVPRITSDVFISELAFVKTSELKASIAAWWFTNGTAKMNSRTLFDPCEFIGGSIHRMLSLISIADRLLRLNGTRDSVLGHDQIVGVRPYIGGRVSDAIMNEGRGAKGFLPIHEGTDIAECVTGLSGDVLISEIATNNRKLREDVELCAEDDAETSNSPAFKPYLLNTMFATNVSMCWTEFLWVMFGDFARELLSPTSPFCIRQDGEGNKLVHLAWPHPRRNLKNGDVAYSKTYGRFLAFFFINRLRPSYGYDVDDSHLRGEHVFAAWSCAYEIIALAGSPPPWYSVDEVWEAVMMRLMPLSYLEDAIRSREQIEPLAGWFLLQKYAHYFDKRRKKKSDSSPRIPIGTLLSGKDVNAPSLALSRAIADWETSYVQQPHRRGKHSICNNTPQLVNVLADAGFSKMEQIEFLAIIARAMSSSACPSIPTNAKKIFAAHVTALADALLFASETSDALLQMSSNRFGCDGSENASSDEEALLRDDVCVAHLGDILALAFAFDLHLASPACLLLAHKIGLGLEVIDRGIRREVRERVGKPFNPNRHRLRPACETSSSEKDGTRPAANASTVTLAADMHASSGLLEATFE